MYIDEATIGPVEDVLGNAISYLVDCPNCGYTVSMTLGVYTNRSNFVCGHCLESLEFEPYPKNDAMDIKTVKKIKLKIKKEDKYVR